MNPRTGSDIDDEIRRANGFLVMFDDNQGITQIPQFGEGTQQSIVIALVQSDTGFVENVEDAGESSTNLGGEANSLGFPPGKGHRRPIEREVIESHIQEKLQPGPNFFEREIGNLRLAIAQLELVEAIDAVSNGDLG